MTALHHMCLGVTAMVLKLQISPVIPRVLVTLPDSRGLSGIVPDVILTVASILVFILGCGLWIDLNNLTWNTCGIT